MQAVLRIEALPDEALNAAAHFYAEYITQAREILGGQVEALVIALPQAPHDHTAWRRAAVQNLARQSAPVRVNMVAGGDPAAVDATIAWLAAAPGITGQLLPVSGAFGAKPA